MNSVNINPGPNIFWENIANNGYFQSLPKFIQESVKQCGSANNITCEQDLRCLAENMLNAK